MKMGEEKYPKMPAKLVINKPWEEFCVDLILLFTLTDKDEPHIDFMFIIMIDPARERFKIKKLTVSQLIQCDILTWTKRQIDMDKH